MIKSEFTIFPAIDLRQGSVVRLVQGDPRRQTVYDKNPADTARRWLDAGSSWLHVVNLDGAFGEQEAANRLALARILQVAGEYQAQVQFGGGLRTFDAVRTVFDMGVARTVLGTILVEQLEVLALALESFGSQRIAAGVDARDGWVRVRGWTENTSISARELSQQLASLGVAWLVFTDVSRDGTGQGLNLAATVEIAHHTGINLIASGGVNGPDDILKTRQAGLAGVIVGRALYEHKIDLAQMIHLVKA